MLPLWCTLKGQSLPSTAYEIYLSVIHSIVSCHFGIEGKGHDLPCEVASLDGISRSSVAGKNLQWLCEMAYQGVIQNKVTFSPSEFCEGLGHSVFSKVYRAF